MPPWPPDKSYRTFAHERLLTQQEKDLINDWVNQGAVQGNPGNAPAPPTYSGAAQITNPDLTLRIPDFTLPTTMTSDIYRCFVVPTGITADKFATSLEVLPGNPAIVHHVLLFEDTSSTPVTLDNNEAGPGYTCFGGTGSQTSKLIGGWTPGASAYTLPSGMGIKLNANTRLVVQVHYPMGSDGQLDSTRFNFKLTTGSLREVSIASILWENYLINGPLHIPANTVQSFTERYTLPGIDFTLLSIFPHMHLLGQTIKSYSISPVGDTTKLISIPQWSFHWQGSYFFRHPVRVPAGSNLYAEATYDNTTNNPDNPNDPPLDVNWGENTTDEMMMVFYGYLPYFPGDENIVVDTSTVTSTYNNCNEFTTGISNAIQNSFSVYPNPTSGLLYLKNPNSETLEIKLMDATGALIRSKIITGNDKLDISGIARGMYMLRVDNGREILFKKIALMN
jgi:hypothetical protein